MRTRARANGRGGWTRVLLLVGSLWLAPALPAAAEDCVGDFGGVMDGNVMPNPPSQVQIDGNCRVLNYPASNPLTTNFSFLTQPGQQDQRWLVIFDNVVHIGNMSCDATHDHKLWFTNSSFSTIQPNCQNLLIPVEKIQKENPAGNAATVGVPFTYRLVVPVLFDPATGNVIDFAGSPNELHSITVWDDLNATGVDLDYVSHRAYWAASGAPVPLTFTNAGGFLTFDDIPIVPAETQFIIEITVVLRDTPANAPGTQFVNTAKWDFGRLIDGVFYEPLPGEWGVSPPMTIVAPNLVVDKTGPATMNLGPYGQFSIDVHNTGTGDAWNPTIVDRLPDGAAGGMCDLPPEVVSITLAGTPIAPATGYTFAWTGAPACEFSLTLLDAAGGIGPDEHLVVSYRTKVDPDTPDGAMLTNVAGATRWFNGDSTNVDRIVSTRTLTDGTVGTADHEDAHTVTLALAGVFFEKTAADVTTGADPAIVAAPGDVLRYTLRIRTTTEALANAAIHDAIDALNDPAVFVPGTLTRVGPLPPGAVDTSNASTGVIDIGNLDVPAGSEVLVSFDVTLAGSIANGTTATNQSQLLVDGAPFMVSDDPNVNGVADPLVTGDEDPTRITIASAPLLRVLKTSQDITGDPAVLLAGDTLRYTITVKNIGNANVTDAMIRDQVPVNTAYVAGSTTLNGVVVPDASGTTALALGMPIHAPENPTPGVMRADYSATTANVATITFDVVVDPDTVQGTIISNQGFVSALGAGIVDYPSDDPDTDIPNDPTRDIVGYLPLLFAAKSAALQVDLGSPGIVDPGDVLRYTITVYNTGTIPATGVRLLDMVPANTTYVADSTTLNGLAFGRPDAGVSPLFAGVDVSSTDLTPPLPASGQGTLTPGGSGVVQFDLRVNDGVAGGTLIQNQARVDTVELPDLLTDGDGDPSTGPEPTVVVVGSGQLLSISKQVAVVGGGPAIAGATLEYTVRVTNTGTVPAYYVVITDDLDVPNPGYLAYVDQSATLNGSATGVTVAGAQLTADYAATYGALAAGQVAVLRFRAVIDPQLAIGTTLTNTGIVTWNDPPQTAQASVSIDVGGMVGVGTLNGTAWHDANFNDAADPGERLLADWTVELWRNGLLVHTALTDANGVYRISGVTPNYATADTYELRFAPPGAGANTAKLGRAHSEFTNDLQRIADIVVRAGGNLQALDQPIAPNGVVYNSISRTPVQGAVLTMLNAASRAALPASCFYDPVQQGQVALAYGYYRFDLNFSDPLCPSGGAYLLEVTAPATGYIAGVSEINPPTSDASTAPFSVPTCPGTASDAILATAQHCEVQVSEFAPPPSVAPRTPGTAYHLHLAFDDSLVPGSSQVFNNHIPLDPDLQGALAITKTTPLVNVNRGQLVPYTITFANVTEVPLFDVSLVDSFPAGFRYIEGSARLDGTPVEPVLDGRQLTWGGLSVAGNARRTMLLLLAVGAGVGEGEFVNRAQAVQGITGNALSGVATATVRVIPDATFDCTDVTGKVFADADLDGYQDEGEDGLAGVRLVTARGLAATTDSNGRYHITCAITPHEGRGSNFVLKLDDRTLPAGYRESTSPVRVERATRGKALRINFGAAIHRVIGLDIADPVFEPGATEMRAQWKPRMELLLAELKKGPSVLRLSYLADVEDRKLVERRVEAIKREVAASWKALDCCYELRIEQEVFWRRGEPPRQEAARVPAP